MIATRALIKNLARQRKESSIQAAVLAVFRGYGILCWPMNREKGGRNRAAHVGFKGLPDIGGVLPGGRAFFAEVKRPGETLGPYQVGARARLTAQGAFVCTVRSVEDAQAAAKIATGR